VEAGVDEVGPVLRLEIVVHCRLSLFSCDSFGISERSALFDDCSFYDVRISCSGVRICIFFKDQMSNSPLLKELGKQSSS